MLTIERGLPPQLHEFINQLKQKYTMELVNTQCNPRFEHEYALSRLKRENFKVAVCSNSVRSTVDTMLRRANLDRYIDVSLSNEDVIHAKPDPEIYLKAMDFFQLAPYECLVVEDNENGVRAAEASGAHVMVVSDTREVCYSNIRERLKAN
jgi:HAD superfamily hydrolase (TIGR01509 family)